MHIKLNIRLIIRLTSKALAHTKESPSTQSLKFLRDLDTELEYFNWRYISLSGSEKFSRARHATVAASFERQSRSTDRIEIFRVSGNTKE
jgi:hypothetical protein